MGLAILNAALNILEKDEKLTQIAIAKQSKLDQATVSRHINALIEQQPYTARDSGTFYQIMQICLLDYKANLHNPQNNPLNPYTAGLLLIFDNPIFRNWLELPKNDLNNDYLDLPTYYTSESTLIETEDALRQRLNNLLIDTGIENEEELRWEYFKTVMNGQMSLLYIDVIDDLPVFVEPSLEVLTQWLQGYADELDRHNAESARDETAKQAYLERCLNQSDALPSELPENPDKNLSELAITITQEDAGMLDKDVIEFVAEMLKSIGNKQKFINI